MEIRSHESLDPAGWDRRKQIRYDGQLFFRGAFGEAIRAVITRRVMRTGHIMVLIGYLPD